MKTWIPVLILQLLIAGSVAAFQYDGWISQSSYLQQRTAGSDLETDDRFGEELIPAGRTRLFTSTAWRFRFNPSMTVQLKGRYAIGITSDDSLDRAELTRFVLRWRKPGTLYGVSLGRVSLFERLLPYQIDGISSRSRLSRDIDLGLTAGLRTPRDQSFDYDADGEREIHALAWMSYRFQGHRLKLFGVWNDAGQDGMTAIGADVTPRNLAGIQMRGLFAWNLTESRPTDWYVNASRQIGSRVYLNGQYRLVAPKQMPLGEDSWITPQQYDLIQLNGLFRCRFPGTMQLTYHATLFDEDTYHYLMYGINYNLLPGVQINGGAVYLTGMDLSRWQGALGASWKSSFGLKLQGRFNMAGFTASEFSYGGFDADDLSFVGDPYDGAAWTTEEAAMGSDVRLSYQWSGLTASGSVIWSQNPVWEQQLKMVFSLRYALRGAL